MSTKTNKHQAVTLPAFTLDELRRWSQQAEELLAQGIRQSTRRWFASVRWRASTATQSLAKEFDRFIRRLGLPRVRFHDPRHSDATQLLANGVHPKIAQKRLGHSSISTNLDLYSDVTDTMQDQAAEQLDAVWKKAFGSNSDSKTR